MRTPVVGRQYGRLTVTGFDRREEKSGRYKYFYRCRCSCGKVLSVSLNSLVTGHTRSCGCFQRELAKEKMSILLQRMYGKTI